MSTEHYAAQAKHGGWVGVDFDGTLSNHGAPVPRMVARVREWIAAGVNVRVFTAHAEDPHRRLQIEGWCVKHLGGPLKVTNKKDALCMALWDDRAVQVVPNTGERVDGLP